MGLTEQGRPECYTSTPTRSGRCRISRFSQRWPCHATSNGEYGQTGTQIRPHGLFCTKNGRIVQPRAGALGDETLPTNVVRMKMELVPEAGNLGDERRRPKRQSLVFARAGNSGKDAPDRVVLSAGQHPPMQRAYHLSTRESGCFPSTSVQGCRLVYVVGSRRGRQPICEW